MGNPWPHVKWYKDDDEVIPDGKYQMNNYEDAALLAAGVSGHKKTKNLILVSKRIKVNRIII